MKHLLLNYAKYNLWANKKVFDFLSTLTDEQLEKEIVSSFSSLRKTVFHFYGAQELWLKRLQGNSPSVFPDYTSKTSQETLQLLLETSKQLIEFVETSGDAFLQSPLIYKNIAGDEFKNSVGDILQHVVNHSTYHRGQIITMLRQLGFTKLFSTDYITYCRENN